ncbi:helix-turn-helix transcriptional regulator [Vibrio amylolyticus]|uniref:helix-turn-helix transcriptional regulator n=1 Tax=Vibrio amylolyticus TaxID=2847292 RepID=UPI00354F73A8
MNHPYQVTVFRAETLQKLRNVRVHSPCLIQIISGSKRLYWKDTTVDLAQSQLLISEASASLNFENLPQKGLFQSRVYSFQSPPSQSMLELSLNKEQESDSPTLAMDNALLSSLNALFSFNQSEMSQQAQTFWLMGLYQQLAEKGWLHKMFPNRHASLTQKLSQYLSHSPGDDHPLESIAERFAMSRATMMRKLKQEGTQYRELLAEVRLNHALRLMQKEHYSVALLSQLCGYQSEDRFSQRFKRKFGLTPKSYMRTIKG